MPWQELERTVAQTETGPADRMARLMTGLPHAQVRGLFDHGCVTVNGAPLVLHGAPLSVGDQIRIRFEAGRRYREKPRVHEEHAFKLVYEDAHLLVVDKAAGVLTVPTERGEQAALVYAIGRYLSRGRRLNKRVSIVHRLDRDTSGLLVFAKRREVADALKNQFRDRKPEREYLAILAGHLEKKQGTIEGYLATDPRLNQYTTSKIEHGKLAITHYEVIQQVHRATVVRVHLETGRRNQIRVHFAERGHPVLGDVRYLPEQATHPRWKWKRLALHACVLGFTHPETEQTLRFESPTPDEFAAFLRSASQMTEADMPAPSPAKTDTPSEKPKRDGADAQSRRRPKGATAHAKKGPESRRGKAYWRKH